MKARSWDKIDGCYIFCGKCGEGIDRLHYKNHRCDNNGWTDRRKRRDNFHVRYKCGGTEWSRYYSMLTNAFWSKITYN